MQTDLSDSSFFNHKSVMTDEIMASLEHYPLINNNQLKGIDATLGGGGHSYHLLRKYSDLNIIGLDQDPFARKSAQRNLMNLKIGLILGLQILRILCQRKKFLL